jgi:hypothetical protein
MKHLREVAAVPLLTREERAALSADGFVVVCDARNNDEQNAEDGTFNISIVTEIQAQVWLPPKMGTPCEY